MIVNLFITCYSNHDLLQDTIDHYSSLIPGVKITVYFHSDEILLENDSDFTAINCEYPISVSVIKGMVNKNNKLNKEWVLIINVDQLIEINNTDLLKEYRHGVTELKMSDSKSIGYFKNIFNLPKRVSLKRYKVKIQEIVKEEPVKDEEPLEQLEAEEPVKEQEPLEQQEIVNDKELVKEQEPLEQLEEE
jgi:hypothetical protein